MSAIVVGGGMAGLAAAAYLARAGRPVVLFERGDRLGGRAVTDSRGGFRFNLGPHALYRGGRAVQVLRELGVSFRGGIPSGAGYAVDSGAKHVFPATPWALFRTGLLPLAAKWEAVRFLARVPSLDVRPLMQVSLSRWLDENVRRAELRRFLEALFRLATYANDPERASAGAGIAQLQCALAKNVYYLDDGWETLVQGLRRVTVAAGVQIRTRARVEAVEHDAAVRGVRLTDGTVVPAPCVILAAGPEDASRLVDNGRHPALARWAEAAIPVRAATLDLGCERLPAPAVTFALDVVRPLYFSVHSAFAHLAPPGCATIHAAMYLRHGTELDSRSIEQELESWVDEIQPGWREHVVERRFFPHLTVSHALWTPEARPEPEVPGIEGLFVVGDWVGSEGMLSDASLASAAAAASRVLSADGRLRAA